MGVVCCEAPPELAHDDIDNSGHHDPLSPSGTATVALAARPPSDRPDGPQAALKPTPSLDQAKESANKTNQAKIPQDTKKSVRISDEVTLIPLLTSASFFRKTPKPTTIASNSHGIMPSFRIVTSAVTDQDSQESLVSKSSLWWTKEERKEILHANQKASRDFKRFQPTKMREANLVYSEIVTDCCDRHECHSHLEHSDDDDDEEDISDFFRRERFANASSSTSSTVACRSKKRKRSECSNLDFDPSEISDLTIDLPTIVRGLEWGVMPDAKRYRKAHAKTVLRWQDRFRRMNERRRKQPKRIHWDSTESSSSSSSSGSSSDEEESDINSTSCEKTTRDQQDLLAHKATISSLRSSMLARVFGKSDAMAANHGIATAPELEEHRSNSLSPTPSLMGTESSESENDDDENDDSDSDVESESECDSDDESEDEDEQENQQSFRRVSYCGYYSRLHSSANSQKRMFRPRMMPPTSWR
mmetsp:Transcript_16378/g.41062  ORF Transcript_16378/g.41062 Transcript_16378/m.41062 type:complete len:474 (+) Transcript_16378:247-1668(+)